MEPVYLDNAATTPLAPQVIARMNEVMQQTFGNASTPNYYGRKARAILDEARAVIAKSINAQPGEIVFNSGGSEGDNTAIIMTALTHQEQGKHIITTSIEHEAVLQSMKYLETLGFEVTYLPVNQAGQINVDQVQNALRPDTILVSIMMVNNEIGVLNPIKEIGQLLQDHPAIFHTDAVQSYGLQDIDVRALNVDLLTTSAHKINGPKMLGFMYERADLTLPPLIKGGQQELKRRAGTENVPAIAGFATAVQLNSSKERSEIRQRLQSYKQLLLTLLDQADVEYVVNGPDIAQTTPNILNLWIKGFATSILQIKLDLAGIVVSGGSACTAGSLEPSHVLRAMFGAQNPRVEQSIRVSFNKMTVENDIIKLADALIKIVRAKKG
ncbi:cysteine desulfurase family protein [Bombilactobacillus thymidiniphilus]|uniref:Cysteine desulfurase n=1 Tax=Bombilactobacillus thymidiniphilus TaxID=2923363 RepID=A0ABY4PDJ2_9LACO|nr:cysteine desulfurase family protein [Bombilactobacillus thymidiniphilus]UQS83777.1 cysteine desulfurase [Bombilactobacillus thymidiniphilus]